MKYLLLLALLISCGKNEEKAPEPTDKMAALRAEKASLLGKALELSDNPYGWIAPNDCDGMIPSAKVGAVRGFEKFDIHAAEYPEKGKFGRHPPPWCWTLETGAQGSKTEWSRDMAVAGMFPYCVFKKDLDTCKSHFDYALEHNWVTGSPYDELRTVYTPNVVGLLANIVYYLGGQDTGHRYWPDAYPSGLDDYEAHLQVMQILLRGIVEEGKFSLAIRDEMLERLKEHVARVPDTILYQYVLGKYTGDQTNTIELLLTHQAPASDYQPADERGEAWEVAERLFVIDRLLEDYGE